MVNPPWGTPKIIPGLQRTLAIQDHVATQQKTFFDGVMATMRQVAVARFELNQVQPPGALGVEVQVLLTVLGKVRFDLIGWAKVVTERWGQGAQVIQATFPGHAAGV